MRFIRLYILFLYMYAFFYGQITKLIEDSSARSNRNAIQEDVILDWLVEKKVLSIALEGTSSFVVWLLRLFGSIVQGLNHIAA